jgi:hypothetical protein
VSVAARTDQPEGEEPRLLSLATTFESHQTGITYSTDVVRRKYSSHHAPIVEAQEELMSPKVAESEEEKMSDKVILLVALCLLVTLGVSIWALATGHYS